MIEIMTREHSDHSIDRLLASLRMEAALGELPRVERAKEGEIPPTESRLRRHREVSVGRIVAPRPIILVERLNPVIVLGDRLPDPKPDRDLDIRQLGEHRARAPFARAKRDRQTWGADLASEIR